VNDGDVFKQSGVGGLGSKAGKDRVECNLVSAEEGLFVLGRLYQ